MSANLGAAIAEIKQALGSGGFIDQPAEMQQYLTSWRNGWTGKSLLIALPSTTQQVSDILSICHRHKVAVVPQGGNTGLVGGCVPSKEGNEIVICLSRLNKIREIDAVGSTMTVEAGVILQTVQDTAAKNGFLFPISMGSQGSAQMGGVVSTNAGGTAVLRYGMTRDLVLGIEAVLPDGQIFASLKKLPKDNTGYNLSQYFVGAEGTLGIVTAVTLKLFPELKQTHTAILAIASPAAALDLLKEFRRESAEYLTAFEIMAHEALRLVTKHIPNARFPGKEDAPYYLLIELGAASVDVPLRGVLETLASAALEKGQVLDAVIAESTAQSKQFWYLREHISEALAKQGNGLYFDVSLPLDKLAEFLRVTEPKVKAVTPDITLLPFGHIGDGNLHYNMYFAPTHDAAAFIALKKKMQDIVYSETKKLQGSISAEHGIGVERKAALLDYKSPIEVTLMKQVKHAIDPNGLMNPGKIFDH